MFEEAGRLSPGQLPQLMPGKRCNFLTKLMQLSYVGVCVCASSSSFKSLSRSGVGQAPERRWSRSPFHCRNLVWQAAHCGMPATAWSFHVKARWDEALYAAGVENCAVQVQSALRLEGRSATLTCMR